MDSKLILVEGIPSAGKTTTAKSIKKELEEQGKKVNLYEEGMSHPADMSWQSYLTEEEYRKFLDNCLAFWEQSAKTIAKEELTKCIQKQARHEDTHVLLAYTRIQFPEDGYWELIADVANKELCDGRSSLDVFKEIHLHRWSRFAREAKDKEEVTIFECAFLQNHIFELLGVYEKSDDEILSYLKELIHTVDSLSPSIVYIKPLCVEQALEKAAQERKAPNSARKDWIDEIADWIEHTNYGKSHNFKGKDGVVQFCKERLRIDEFVIEHLGIPVSLIERK